MSVGKVEATNKAWKTAMHYHGQAASTAFITN
jgi:hypothetical protein